MKAHNYFQIGYVGDRFLEVFGSMPFTRPKKFTIQTKRLERSMSDKEILSEFEPESITLEHLAYALKNLERKGWYIFYIKDATGTLWAVRASWDASCGDWFVRASSVGRPREWRAGRQVVSQVFGSGKIGPLELGTIDYESRIQELERFKKKVESMLVLD